VHRVAGELGAADEDGEDVEGDGREGDAAAGVEADAADVLADHEHEDDEEELVGEHAGEAGGVDDLLGDDVELGAAAGQDDPGEDDVEGREEDHPAVVAGVEDWFVEHDVLLRNPFFVRTPDQTIEESVRGKLAGPGVELKRGLPDEHVDAVDGSPAGVLSGLEEGGLSGRVHRIQYERLGLAVLGGGLVGSSGDKPADRNG